MLPVNQCYNFTPCFMFWLWYMDHENLPFCKLLWFMTCLKMFSNPMRFWLRMTMLLRLCKEIDHSMWYYESLDDFAWLWIMRLNLLMKRSSFMSWSSIAWKHEMKIVHAQIRLWLWHESCAWMPLYNEKLKDMKRLRGWPCEAETRVVWVVVTRSLVILFLILSFSPSTMIPLQ